MGNELSMTHDMADLEKYLEGHSVTPEVLARHAWDRHNISPHLTIQPDQVTVKKTSKSNHKEVVLGKVGYSQGIHVFEFKWNPTRTMKHVAIGIASENINVHSESGDYLLGNDDQSIAWDLMTHDIVFNGCVIKQVPQSTDVSSALLDETLIMVLDMDQGSLSYKVNDTFEVAMKGLKHASDSFHVAACLSKHGDAVTMKYLGSSDLAREGTAPENVKLRFHEICGKNIVLSEDNFVASRNKPRDTFNHATVFTNRPLKDGEMFTVSLKSMDETKWSGCITLGVSTVSPLEINFIDWMPSCTQGKTCLFKDKYIVEQDNETETQTNLDRLKEGSTIGVCRKGGKLEFYVNGEHEISYRTTIRASEEIYGCVDVYGQAVAVKLLSRDIKSKDGDHDLKGQIMELGRAPARRVFLSAIEETLKLMQKHNASAVSRVASAIENNMIYPFNNVKDKQLKENVAEQMARMDSAKTFKEYLQFLKREDLDSETLSVQCYDLVLQVCVLYSKISMALCRQFGSSGLLQLVIDDLQKMQGDWKKSRERTHRARKLMTIAHKCSEANETKSIFQQTGFVQIASKYLTDAEIGIDALFASANVYIDKECRYLEAPENLCSELATRLNRASRNPMTQKIEASRLASGINALTACPSNIPRFVKAGMVKSLKSMLEIHESNPQECALNAIWSLLTAETFEDIRKTDGLMALLRDLEVSSYPEVKQGAKRVMIKLNQLREPMVKKVESSAKISAGCEYARICREFKESLGVNNAYFSKDFEMCYCETCHGNRGDRGYYARGVPPKDYGLPIGWFRFSLVSHPRMTAEKMFEKWHRAYHGTKKEFLSDIFKVGELCPAGRRVVGGKDIKELPNHFTDDRKPDGFNTKQVFLSPSIRYSGVDTYAAPSYFTSKNKTKYVAKVALQVLICPGEYRVGPQTIGAYAELDPGFSNQELEWMTDSQGSTAIYGLLVKLTPA